MPVANDKSFACAENKSGVDRQREIEYPGSAEDRFFVTCLLAALDGIALSLPAEQVGTWQTQLRTAARSRALRYFISDIAFNTHGIRL